MPSKWLSATEAAERLGIDRSTVSRYVAEGKLPAQHTAGGHYRIAEQVIETFLRGNSPSKSEFVFGPHALAPRIQLIQP